MGSSSREANPKAKRQHYVPAFYLRSFSIKGKQHHLYCFDKSNFLKAKRNIKNLCCESYFYDTFEDIDQQTEKAFSYQESVFKNAYDKLNETQDLSSLTSDEKKRIAYFVTTQELRTKKWRQVLKNLPRQFGEGISQMAAKLPQGKWSEELRAGLKLEQLMYKKLANDEEAIKALHISTLEDIPEYVNIICNKWEWIIFVNRSAMSCWSSDHPVTRYNPIDLRPRGNLGLLCPGIEIYFPLNPKLSLCIRNPIQNLSTFLPKKYEVSDIRGIRFLNSLQVSQSVRYILSNQSDFSLAESMIKDSPPLSDVNRRE